MQTATQVRALFNAISFIFQFFFFKLEFICGDFMLEFFQIEAKRLVLAKKVSDFCDFFEKFHFYFIIQKER